MVRASQRLLRLKGKGVGNKQYIRDDDGKLLRKLEEICERWRNFSFFAWHYPDRFWSNNHRRSIAKSSFLVTWITVDCGGDKACAEMYGQRQGYGIG